MVDLLRYSLIEKRFPSNFNQRDLYSACGNVLAVQTDITMLNETEHTGVM